MRIGDMKHYDNARDSINFVVEAHRTFLQLCPIDGRTEMLIKDSWQTLKRQAEAMLAATEKFMHHEIKRMERDERLRG